MTRAWGTRRVDSSSRCASDIEPTPDIDTKAKVMSTKTTHRSLFPRYFSVFLAAVACASACDTDPATLLPHAVGGSVFGGSGGTGFAGSGAAPSGGAGSGS